MVRANRVSEKDYSLAKRRNHVFNLVQKKKTISEIAKKLNRTTSSVRKDVLFLLKSVRPETALRLKESLLVQSRKSQTKNMANYQKKRAFDRALRRNMVFDFIREGKTLTNISSQLGVKIETVKGDVRFLLKSVLSQTAADLKRKIKASNRKNAPDTGLEHWVKKQWKKIPSSLKFDEEDVSPKEFWHKRGRDKK